MQDPVALVSIPTVDLTSGTCVPGSPVRFEPAAGARHPLALCGFGATALLAIGFVAAGFPVISVGLLAASSVASFVLGSAIGFSRGPRETRPRPVPPDEILASDVRASYRAILLALEEVEDALVGSPHLGSAMTAVVERCRAAAGLAGRIALISNPLQRYLDLHDPGYLRATLDRLRTRAEVARDDAASGAWSHAVAARVRQLATVEQIVAKRDQICARLALVHAALDAFAAAIVRLHAVGEEQIVLAGDAVSDQLEDIGDELASLETALELELAS